jgi:hypothetical protein
MVFVAISPWELSPYVIRGTCKGWMIVYDTGLTWKNLLQRHLVPEEESITGGGFTADQARRECNLRLQAPLQSLIQVENLREFRKSGNRALVLCNKSCSSLPGRQFYIIFYTYS